MLPQTDPDCFVLEGGEALLVEVAEDGAVLLRPYGGETFQDSAMKHML